MGAIILIAVSCIILAADALLKAYAESRFAEGEEQEILDGKAVLRNVHNKGMALNAFDKHPDVVKYLSGALGIGLTVYTAILMLRKGRRLKKVGLAMILGGAWSNIYDRWVRGYVVDYIGFKTKSKCLSDITFNIGDFFIFAGGIIVVISSLLRRNR